MNACALRSAANDGVRHQTAGAGLAVARGAARTRSARDASTKASGAPITNAFASSSPATLFTLKGGQVVALARLSGPRLETLEGPRRYPEFWSPVFSSGVQSMSDVLDPQDLDLVLAGGRAHLHHVALEGAHQRPRDGRDPAHMAAAGIDLVDADDLDRALFALGVGIGDGGAEEHLLGPGPLGRIDDLRALQPLAEEADASVDLAQALLAVEIVTVLRAVAVGRRPRHDLHHLGPLLAHERHQLLAQALEALGSHVVLGAGGQARDLVGQIVVVLAVAFLGESLAHFLACSIKNGPMTTTPSLLQRARGESRVAFDLRERRTRLRDLYQRDPCRVLFPEPEPGEPPLRGGTSVGPYAEVSLQQ